MKKRLSFKKIISLILVATIAGASLCLLTACGNNKTINDTYANDGEILYCRSYKLEKDKNYVINITDNSGNKYDRLLIKATQKTALRLRNSIIPNNM